MNKTTWLQRFFFVTYAAFLLPSIPHIASYFLSFEVANGYSLFFWVGVSYLIAIAIDGTLLWLTHTVARSTGGRGYRFVIWLFIFFLVIFSGFLNWHIAQHNAVVASEQLSGAFIPNVDPIIASLFPVLGIMYAVMSKHIFAETKMETLAEKAARLEAEKELRKRINAAKPSLIQWSKGKALELKQAKDEVFNAGSSVQNQPQKEHDTGPIVNPNATFDGIEDGTLSFSELEYQEENTLTDDGMELREEEAPITDVHTTISCEENETKSFPEMECRENEIVPENIPDDTSKTGSTSVSTMTFEEAAQVTGYSVATLKKYASQGKIKRSKRDTNLLLASSLAGMENKAKLQLVSNH